MTKKDAMLAIVLVLLALIGYNLAYNLICPEIDFYDFHVGECEHCHSLNKTFALCSGFCYEPSEDDLKDGGCPAIHPLEDCRKTVPHGSNLGTRRCLWQ